MRCFPLLLVVLGLGSVAVGISDADSARADEPFDAEAVACARAAFPDPPEDGSAIDHFQSAVDWCGCLAGAVAPMEDALDAMILEASSPEEKRELKKRRKAVRKVGLAAAGGAGAEGWITAPDFDSWSDPRTQRSVRVMLVVTTDLRFLSLESFRTIWQQSIRGAEARRDDLVALIDASLARLDGVAGAEDTKAGKKAVKLAALAVSILAEMQDARDAMEISVSEVPDFGTPEDGPARRRRKRFKGLGADFGAGLVVLSKIARKIDDKVDVAIAKAQAAAPCELTDPDDPYRGGGFVRASIDDGPEEQWGGQTSLSLMSAKRRIAWIGSDQQARPALMFELYGPKTTKPGVYDVLDRPKSDDAFTRDFAVGSLKLDEGPYGTNVYWLVAGTLRVDTFKTGGKRHIAGSFDVWGEDPETQRLRHVVGTFDLCGFQVERAGGRID